MFISNRSTSTSTIWTNVCRNHLQATFCPLLCWSAKSLPAVQCPVYVASSRLPATPRHHSCRANGKGMVTILQLQSSSLRPSSWTSIQLPPADRRKLHFPVKMRQTFGTDYGPQTRGAEHANRRVYSQFTRTPTPGGLWRKGIRRCP